MICCDCDPCKIPSPVAACDFWLRAAPSEAAAEESSAGVVGRLVTDFGEGARDWGQADKVVG